MKQTNRKADLPLLLLAVVLIFLIVCPVGMIFAKAVMQNGRLDFSPAVQTLLNPENAHMIGNSLLLGVLAVLGICVVPFLNLGVHYLMYKCTAALAATASGNGRITGLIEALGTAFGLILAMTAACAVLLVVAMVSAVSAVTG